MRFFSRPPQVSRSFEWGGRHSEFRIPNSEFRIHAVPYPLSCSYWRFPMPVPLLDLTGQYAALKSEILAAVDDVLGSQMFILGPRVQEFEQSLAKIFDPYITVGEIDQADAPSILP